MLHEIAQNIRAERRRLGLNQAALAKRAQISLATLEAFENGRSHDIGLKKVLRILSAINLQFTIDTQRQHRPTLDALRQEAEELDAFA